MIRLAAEISAVGAVVAGVYMLLGLPVALIFAGALFLLWSFLVG